MHHLNHLNHLKSILDEIKSNLLSENEMIWLQGWVFAKHDIILWTDRNNHKRKCKVEMERTIKDFLSWWWFNGTPAWTPTTLPSIFFEYSINDKKDDMNEMLEICRHCYWFCSVTTDLDLSPDHQILLKKNLVNQWRPTKADGRSIPYQIFM